MELHQNTGEIDNEIAILDELLDHRIAILDELLDIEHSTIVPLWFYNRMYGSKLGAIILLSELSFLHRKTNGKEFDYDYSYFENKLNLSHHELEEAIKYLKKKGFIQCSSKTFLVDYAPKALHLMLNLDEMMKEMPTKFSTKIDNHKWYVHVRNEHEFYDGNYLETIDLHGQQWKEELYCHYKHLKITDNNYDDDEYGDLEEVEDNKNIDTKFQ